MRLLVSLLCNLCGHLQRCQMPDTENSRKNSRKRCRVGPCKTAEKQPEEEPKHPQNSQNSCFFGCFGCSSGCFSAVLQGPSRHPFRLFSRLFSVSGIRHLCRWPQRLQSLLLFRAFSRRFPKQPQTNRQKNPYRQEGASNYDEDGRRREKRICQFCNPSRSVATIIYLCFLRQSFSLAALQPPEPLGSEPSEHVSVLLARL